MELDKIYNMDCLEGLASLPDKCIDLVVTDPPYEITGTYHSGTNKLCKSVSAALTQLTESNIDKGFDKRVLDELWRVMKIPNIYIWCNIKQIPFYVKYFIEERGCSMEMLFWYKTNAMPLFGGKYLIDKEFCLYFRKGGYCNPKTYEEAKTVFFEPINAKDKKMWGHPTIKPLSMIDRLVRNSTKEGDIVLDPFMGSGTTAIAAIKEKRHFLGYELNKEYYDKANQRIQNEINTLKLFE